MPGRPGLYLPFLAVLSDNEIHCPATIVRYGKECGLFDHYIALQGKDEHHLRINIRHTLARFVKNHHFPKDGDGWIEPSKQQQMMIGWTGYRWKQAAKIAIEKAAVAELDQLYLEKVGRRISRPRLLEKKALFVFSDVCGILKIHKNAFILAARVLAAGGYSTWELMGMVPMDEDQWLINMPRFAHFFQECQTLNGPGSLKWKPFSLLRVLDIYPLDQMMNAIEPLSIKDIQKMTKKKKADLGIWTTPQIQGFVIRKAILTKSLSS